MSYEFNLVLFTVFGQLAAGLALLAWLTCLHRYPAAERRVWLAVVLSGIIALAGGLPHFTALSPMPFALAGLGSSWLSAEILAGIVFGAAVLLRVGKILKGKHNFLPGILGVVFVLLMAQVYFQNPVLPLWSTWGTILGFLAAMLVLSGAVLPILAPEARSDACFLKASLFAFLAGAIFISVLPIFWLAGVLLPLDPQILRVFVTAAVCMGLTQMAALTVGGILLAASLPNRHILAGLGACLVVAGVLVGRMLFYAAQIKIGL